MILFVFSWLLVVRNNGRVLHNIQVLSVHHVRFLEPQELTHILVPLHIVVFHILSLSDIVVLLLLRPQNIVVLVLLVLYLVILSANVKKVFVPVTDPKVVFNFVTFRKLVIVRLLIDDFGKLRYSDHPLRLPVVKIPANEWSKRVFMVVLKQSPLFLFK